MAKYDVKENLFMYITYGSYKRATNQWALIFIGLSAFGKRCEEAELSGSPSEVGQTRLEWDNI